MPQPSDRVAQVVRRTWAMKNSKESTARSERVVEQQQGLAEERRGSPAAESDKPEGDIPHPQDVNEMGRPS